MGILFAALTSSLMNRAPLPAAVNVQEFYEANKSLSTQPAETAHLISVIGDSYTTGSNMGGTDTANWTALAAGAMNKTSPTIISKFGAGGAGYVKRGSAGTTFGENVSKVVKPETDVILFFGSRNDGDTSAESVSAAANVAYKSAKGIAPSAALVVIGAPWVNDKPPASLIAINAALSAATMASGGEYIDPIAEGWFTEDKESLIGSDGVHPVDEGHQYMADLIVPHLESALAK